jgi:hypothetical protein
MSPIARPNCAICAGVGFGAAVLHVRRVKNGAPSTHPLRGDELRPPRRLQRESESSPFVFVSRGLPAPEASFNEAGALRAFCSGAEQRGNIR